MKIYNCDRNYTDEQLKELEAEFVCGDMINEIINETSMGYDENGELLFYFIKNVFTIDFLEITKNSFPILKK